MDKNITLSKCQEKRESSEWSVQRYIWVSFTRLIDARVCQRCIKEPEPSQLICEPMKESSLAISPIILAEGDSETDSSDTSDYPDTEEKQGLSKTRTVTYTTVHFDNKKQLPDYENIVETPDYVNVHIKGANDKNKKQKKKVQSVDYTIVAPMPVPFRRPSHLQATATDSSSS
ncbi:uncharacterized protein RB166_003162 [Leptodactylus fuscus]